MSGLPGTVRWENLPIVVQSSTGSLEVLDSAIIGPEPMKHGDLLRALDQSRRLIDPRDAAIEDLRNQLAESRERAERAEARSRELETRLQAVREVVK